MTGITEYAGTDIKDDYIVQIVKEDIHSIHDLIRIVIFISYHTSFFSHALFLTARFVNISQIELPMAPFKFKVLLYTAKLNTLLL